MKKKFRCLVCGYVYEGENPPAECPQCHAKSDKFVEVKDEGKLVWACEHHVGDGKVEDAEMVCTTISTESAPKWECISR